MTSTIASVWESRRTRETRKVEDLLLRAGFEKVDAYRYNSASIRLRVIDARFEGRSIEKRDAMVEPFLRQLPERTQADIITLFTFAPNELGKNYGQSREALLNLEFEHWTESAL
jgi:hypothetical protein